MSFLFCVCVFSHSKILMINLHCFHCYTQPTVQHSSIITVSKEVKFGVSKGHAFLFNWPFFVPNLDTFVFSFSEYAISKLITGILWKIWSVRGSKRRQWSRFYCLTVKSTEAETMKKNKSMQWWHIQTFHFCFLCVPNTAFLVKSCKSSFGIGQ